MNDPWAETSPAEQGAARTRRAVGLVAWVALAVSLTGAVVGIAAPDDRTTPQHLVAGGLLAAALLVAALCLRHGHRHEHERGRVPAAVAIVVALALFVASETVVVQ